MNNNENKTVADELDLENLDTNTSEELKNVKDILTHLREADVFVELTEIKFSKDGDIENSVCIFEANSLNSLNECYFTENYSYLFLNFGRNGAKQDKVVFKTAFDTYLKKYTQKETDGENIAYLLVYTFIIEDEKNGVIKGIKVPNPMLCYEDANDTLRIVAGRDGVNFFAEGINYYKIQEQLQYEMADLDKDGQYRGLGYSTLNVDDDDDDDDDEPKNDMYIDNM